MKDGKKNTVLPTGCKLEIFNVNTLE